MALSGNRLTIISEKARIPAWTDRILRKGQNLRQINYNSAPLRFSDHRPVYATFQCTVSIVDEELREQLSRQIYERRRAEVDGTTIMVEKDSDSDDLMDYDSIEDGLPPASSDRGKWWLDNGQPARSTLKPPQAGLVPNPSRPSNPYTVTDEPDWVTVDRATPRVSTSRPVPTRTTTNGSRKLPPPFKSVDSLSTANTNMSQITLQDHIGPNGSSSKPTPPTGRRLSTATTASNSSRKAPPPIARKPVHLTSNSSLSSSPTLSTKSRDTFHSAVSQYQRSTSIDHTGFAPPPRRATTATPSSRASTPSEMPRSSNAPPPPEPRKVSVLRKAPPARDQYDGDGTRPSLPPRRPTDLLSGEDDGGLDGWEALRPT